MAKIIKIGSQNTTLTSRTSNLAKTSRSGNSTNPFKFSNFEGNTLQFADVFEGFEPKKQNKLRMIASSVTGSMNKMRSGITEPIMNFVNRVRGGISNAWDYANNTNLSDLPGIKQISELPAVKSFNDIMNTPIELNFGINMNGIKDSFASMGRGISSRMESWNPGINIDYLNKDMKDVWSDLVSKVSSSRYTADTPVSVLEADWKSIISNESAEVAA